MKIKLIIAVIIFIGMSISSISYCNRSNISRMGKFYEYVIFKPRNTFKQYFDNDVQKCWTPDVNIIGEYEKELNIYFLNNKHLEIPYSNVELIKIIDNIEKFKCQYFGVIIKKHKYLYCNYFIAEDWKNDEWKYGKVHGADGGWHFWNVLFDVENNKIVEIRTNGTL
jgi:hypothetical protein